MHFILALKGIFYRSFINLIERYQEEGAKKLKEGSGSLNTGRASDIPDEMFTESLKFPHCVNILFSCIKNVEKQITQIFENTK